MISIKYIPVVSFIFFIFLDYLIKNNYLGGFIKTKYLNFIELGHLVIVITIAIIVLSILMLFSYFEVAIICFDYYLLEFELLNSMSEGSGECSGVNSNTSVNSESDNNNSDKVSTIKNISTEANVNINNPGISVSIPLAGVNNLAAAASVAGGGGLALKAMQQMPGGPGVKAIAGAATMLGSQALTIGMSKILNNSNLSNSKKYTSIFYYYSGCSGVGLENNKFISITSLGDKYQEFPLNLLPEINQLVTAELMFLFVILNILFVKYLISLDLDLNKYTPNNKLGELLKWLISRYIQMYSKSAKILLIFCFTGLFICVIGSKIFLYYVLNY